MAKIIPPRRDEILSKEGLGELRFLNYLEENADQTNDSTEAIEAEPASVNLSNAQVSQINKKIAEIVSESLITNNALVSKLNKRIEQLENVILSSQSGATNKKISAIENDFLATFYKTKYEKLTIKKAIITDATVSTLLTAPSGTWAAAGINLLFGSSYKINGTIVLNGSTLGAGITTSSLTSVGTLTSLNVSGTVNGPSGSWLSDGMNLGATDAYSINGTVVLNSTTLGSGVTSSSLTSVGTLTSVNTSGAYSVDGTQVVSNQGAAVTDASGGATIDAEARTAINTLLARVRVHGLIA